MAARPSLVVTSIAEPKTLAALAAGARAHAFDFVVIGDEGSPAHFELEGCDFYGLDRQRRLDLDIARLCPTRHYARKNVGYLLAMRSGASLIVETDDDTIVDERFWRPRERVHTGRTVADHGWVNVCRYFSRKLIWPRGLPLDEARVPPPAADSLEIAENVCPIQQHLVDDDPDVDAVYRLLFELPFHFEQGPSVALGTGAWCPFNSQNTTWFPESFPLLYLPAYCSFRMTDIWRSFVAQRIAWANGWSVLFHAPNARQERNTHDLVHDFRDEVPGYLENRAICAALEELDLAPGTDQLAGNMRLAYERLVAGGWMDERELLLLDAWLSDVAQIVKAPGSASQLREPRQLARAAQGSPVSDSGRGMLS